MTALVRLLQTYIAQYGLKRGLWRIWAKLRSPVFRPLLFASLREKVLRQTRVNPQTPGSETDQPASISYARCAALLRKADMLILDNDIGGGAKIFRTHFEQKLKAKGKRALLALYNSASGTYEILCTEDKKTACLKVENVVLRQLIEDNQPQAVFLNSLVGWPEPVIWLEWLGDIARKVSVQVYLHDYFCLCPTIVLLGLNFHYCGLPQDESVCSGCLKKNLFAAPYTPPSLSAWRSAWSRLFQNCSEIGGPHWTVAELAGRVYPDVATKFFVCLEAALPSLTSILSYSPQDPALPMTIAAVGQMDIHKGGLIVAELFRLMRQKSNSDKLIVIGEMGVPFEKGAFPVTGRYRREDLPGILSRHKVTVCLVPSVCPETFCYVIDELMSLGVPVVSFDIGAQGAKAKLYDRGVPILPISADACLKAISAIEEQRRKT